MKYGLRFINDLLSIVVCNVCFNYLSKEELCQYCFVHDLEQSVIKGDQIVKIKKKCPL